MKNGWQVKRVSEIAKHSLGKMLDKAKNKGEFRPYLRNLNVRWFDFDLADLAEMRFLPEEADKHTVKKGDLVICEGGYPGRAAIWNRDEPIYFQKALHRVRFHEPQHAKWCLYYLLAQDLEGTLKNHFNGAGIQHFTGKVLDRFAIPLPPLPEQRRIVGILDEAFEGIATAKANAEKNLQNARALFESHLQGVFSQHGEGWVQTTLGSEIDLLAGFAFKSAQYTNADDDVRLLRGDNIIQGCLRWDDVKKWPAEDIETYKRYQLQEGDVVLAMDRPWVKAGLKHATIFAADLPCLLVQRTARLRGGVNLENRFVMYLIGSDAFTSHILGVQTGIGVPHISGQQIKDFEFARPPVAEQRRIADNLESLRGETQRLASLYHQKVAALDELKKSLLDQAFTGQL
ncbi:MAG: restriction endonuclease subunit S [Acidobacteriales bacterium]|nr:restriction endonuclease subunit S [Terriglobales bacterium]